MFKTEAKLSEAAIRTVEDFVRKVKPGSTFWYIDSDGYSGEPKYTASITVKSLGASTTSNPTIHYSYLAHGEEPMNGSDPVKDYVSGGRYPGVWLQKSHADSYLMFLKKLWRQVPGAISEFATQEEARQIRAKTPKNVVTH